MEVKFNRRRLLSIDSAINMGRYITSPKESRRVRQPYRRTILRMGLDRSA